MLEIKRKKISLFNSLDCNGLIRRLGNGEYRLYSKTKRGKTFTCKNLGTFSSLSAARSYQQNN